MVLQAAPPRLLGEVSHSLPACSSPICRCCGLSCVQGSAFEGKSNPVDAKPNPPAATAFGTAAATTDLICLLLLPALRLLLDKAACAAILAEDCLFDVCSTAAADVIAVEPDFKICCLPAAVTPLAAGSTEVLRRALSFTAKPTDKSALPIWLDRGVDSPRWPRLRSMRGRVTWRRRGACSRAESSCAASPLNGLPDGLVRRKI